jgi:hypothetical protein
MVYLLGCDHYLQEYDRTESIDELWAVEFKAKEQFYELTKNVIESERIQFVGEECRRGQRTIPRVVATELGCSYAEIDMPIEERNRRGISREYQSLGEEERNRVYNIREDYMLQEVYSKSNVCMRKLIVCGAEHSRGLELRFSRHGEQISKRDLTKKNWVLEIYKRKDEFLLGPRTKS